MFIFFLLSLALVSNEAYHESHNLVITVPEHSCIEPAAPIVHPYTVPCKKIPPCLLDQRD